MSGGGDQKKKDLHRSESLEIAMLPETRVPGFQRDIMFWMTVGYSQAVGIACVGLIIAWMVLDGGFGWASSPKKQFNYHPFFMVLGLVFFYGDAIIIYRVLSFLPKPILKIIHAAIHILAILFSSIALASVFLSHKREKSEKSADLFSLHSWAGLATYALFCLQYIGSFVTFLYPGLPLHWRSRVMGFHTFFGIGIFLMAVATTLMGVTEKLLWTPKYPSGAFPTEGAIGNALGLLLIVFAFLIVFIATRTQYKRQPLPDELPAPVRTEVN